MLQTANTDMQATKTKVIFVTKLKVSAGAIYGVNEER